MYQLKRLDLGTRVLRSMLGPATKVWATGLTLGVLALVLAGPASAQRSMSSDRFGANMSRPPDVPVVAVVSLTSQKITVYSAYGKMLEAPVSTGKPGHETPAGIYSILQKRRYHYSNLYNDAAMPFMQRITWSGIALHAGDLPGYPASHGCIRLPYAFAGQLFELTKRGMRVVVVRDDVSPVEFTHPALFRPGPIQPPAQNEAPGNLHLSSAQGGAQVENASLATPLNRRAAVALKEKAAEDAAKKADEMRRAAAKVERAAEALEDAMWEAERSKKAALARIAEADVLMPASGSGEFAEDLKRVKAKALERLAAAQVQIDAIYAQGKDKIDAARAAREEIKAAEVAKAAAQSEAAAAAGRPISVFISRKTQRLYVRRAFQPLFESEIAILKPTVPIGTTVFTATNWADDDAGLTWTALSMYPNRGQHHARRRPGEAPQTSPEAARAALERVAIPQEALDRISQLISPGSSLIISDEPLSRETGEATDFIVVMSGEAQGGIARRRPANPAIARGYDRFLPGGGFNIFSLW